MKEFPIYMIILWILPYKKIYQVLIFVQVIKDVMILKIQISFYYPMVLNHLLIYMLKRFHIIIKILMN